MRGSRAAAPAGKPRLEHEQHRAAQDQPRHEERKVALVRVDEQQRPHQPQSQPRRTKNGTANKAPSTPRHALQPIISHRPARSRRSDTKNLTSEGVSLSVPTNVGPKGRSVLYSPLGSTWAMVR